MTYLIVKPAECSKRPRTTGELIGLKKNFAYRGLVVVSDVREIVPGDWITFKPLDTLVWHDDEHYYVDEHEVLLIGVADDLT